MRNKQKGFSLIELLIVVAIILIIAAIAIPNLIRSRMAANEASAVATLRTLTTAFISYSTTYGNGLPPNLNVLQNPTTATAQADCDHAGLVDAVLAGLPPGTNTTFSKSGYQFTYIPGGTALTPPVLTPVCSNGGFPTSQVTSLPLSVGGTGQRGFLVDNSGVIYFTTNGTTPVPGTSPVL
jgi:prepilin-type N-terminal cleavage/methylation domain-containing protein